MRYAPQIVKALSKPGLAGFGMALAEYGIEKGITHRKDNNMDLNLSAQNDDSFVISL